MLSNEQFDEVTQTVNESLDFAEGVWKKHSKKLTKSVSVEAERFANAVKTHMPGYPLVSRDTTQVDTFIAIAVDMRDSTKHLLHAHSSSKVQMLERIFYETSALLPALSQAVIFNGGTVPEYLGDGIMGFFLATKDEKLKKKSIYSSHAAAKDCFRVTNHIVK